ncbi:hypothetical protein M405DRAFT_807140, partial [Rhizopogon salebrosus TDB-379]
MIVRYHIIYFALNLTNQILMVVLWTEIPHRRQQRVSQSSSSALHRLFSRPVSSSVFGIRMHTVNVSISVRCSRIVYVGLRRRYRRSTRWTLKSWY